MSWVESQLNQYLAEYEALGEKELEEKVAEVKGKFLAAGADAVILDMRGLLE